MDKEKQIEELTAIIADMPNSVDCIVAEAEYLYNKGYRKQKQGRWETTPRYNPDMLTAYTHTCSECKTAYRDIRPIGHNFCHECGAKMKNDTKGTYNEQRKSLD